MKVERNEWNVISNNQFPPIGESVLCCVDKAVCGADQDFLSTDWLLPDQQFDCYPDCVYAWVHLPKVFIPGETNDPMWIEGATPVNNGTYIVTVLSVDKDSGDEDLMVDILDYNVDEKDDPWDLINNYVASDVEDENHEYSIIAYTDAPELYVRNTMSRIEVMMNSEIDFREEIYALVGFINPYINPEDVKPRIDAWLDDKIPVE